MAQQTFTEQPEQSNNLSQNDYLLASIYDGQSYQSKKLTKDKISGYKVYAALLTQQGTDAPHPIVLKNDFGDTPAFQRLNAGVYRLVFNELPLKDNQTAVLFGSANANSDNSRSITFRHVNVDEKTLEINTIKGSAIYADDLLEKVFFEIRVYN
jgi:hypothetical protein